MFKDISTLSSGVIPCTILKEAIYDLSIAMSIKNCTEDFFFGK